MKTQDKNTYSKEWRLKNRENYLARRREKYALNADRYRESSKLRARNYYYEVLRPKRNADPVTYAALDRARSQKKQEKKRALLRRLKEDMGGRCTDCGYSENIDILQFHHHNDDKEDNVTNLQSFPKIEEEARKCILLCPNCHAIETLKSLRS